MESTDNYWHIVGSAAVFYAHSLLDQDDLRAATEVVAALDRNHGPTAVVDMSAVLLIIAALRCPADGFRTEDGRLDATALTVDGPVDALRILDATALANRYRGRVGFTAAAADLADTEQQVDATEAARRLVQAALDEVPDLGAVARVLRPAADSPRSTAAVIVLATVALLKVSFPRSAGG